ncbi:MAG TPA: hypothetical protein VGK73_29245 [Polyangiaceae bacterium]
MRRVFAFHVLAFGLAGAPRLAAAEPASAGVAFGDRFFRGTSPGELPAPKVLVVSSLYAASLASIIVGASNVIRAGQQSDDAEAYKLSQPPGFCGDLSSMPCATYTDLLAKERSLRASGYGLFAAGGLAALAGALTAELWPNDLGPARVSLELGRTSAGLSAFAEF